MSGLTFLFGCSSIYLQCKNLSNKQFLRDGCWLGLARPLVSID
jgi:hypothetical protein